MRRANRFPPIRATGPYGGTVPNSPEPVVEGLSEAPSDRAPERADARELCEWLDATPSPYHAASHAAEVLHEAGATPEGRDFGTRVVGGMLLAWWRGGGGPACLLGAHTDSPNLRVKPNPDVVGPGCSLLRSEPYGSPLLASWFDRELGLSGRVVLVGGEVRLVRADDAGVRLPRLAIHLDREANTGHTVDPQRHLDLLWGAGAAAPTLRTWLADRLRVADDAIVAWDLMTHDRAAAALGGWDESLLSSGRLDNQVSCWLATDALANAAATASARPVVIALFDHEEVGSATATGAAGPHLERLLDELDIDPTRSILVSADMAHAVHPNHTERHEPAHAVRLAGGPAIKVNVNQRYATDATTAGWLHDVGRAAGVDLQTYVHRADLPCGSTIGPLGATRLGVPTVDVGVPMLAMHAARESMATADVEAGRRLFRAAALAAPPT